ncbi:cytochrome C [Desulfovibrio desulfuricans]|uniref:cytochrome C n=1 Tax=Desulfovibrio desulfuricans TaxID=876 RepID=UPI0035B3F56A
MNFPILHIPVIGDGMTIALNAVLHVCISHGLAIGLMAMLVTFQTLTWQGKGAFWAEIARRVLGPLVIATTSIGAVTGVGIWILTGSLAPEGIGALIHLFFWPWFIEWFAFTAEVVLLLGYYYLWDKLAERKPGVLAAIGWAYVATSFVSAVLITGILGFMLTPQGWPWARSFTEAYFNPTFVPQCFLRVGGGIALGALLLLAWVAWRFKGTPDERGRALRVCGVALLASLAVTATASYVYFLRVPLTYLTHWKFAVATSYLSQLPDFLPAANIVAVLVLALAALAAMGRSLLLSRALCIPALLLSLCMVMEFERVREFIRGPYLMPGYMHASQITLVESEALAADNQPLLPRLRWINTSASLPPAAQAAKTLFAANCGVCHAESGVNGIDQRLAGRSADGINAMLGITQRLAPYMTPFVGSEQERALLTEYLFQLSSNYSRRTQQAAREK